MVTTTVKFLLVAAFDNIALIAKPIQFAISYSPNKSSACKFNFYYINYLPLTVNFIYCFDLHDNNNSIELT